MLGNIQGIRNAFTIDGHDPLIGERVPTLGDSKRIQTAHETTFGLTLTD